MQNLTDVDDKLGVFYSFLGLFHCPLAALAKFSWVRWDSYGRVDFECW